MFGQVLVDFVPVDRMFALLEQLGETQRRFFTRRKVPAVSEENKSLIISSVKPSAFATLERTVEQ